MKRRIKSGFSLLFILVFSIPMLSQVKGNADYLIRYEVEFVLDSLNREGVTREIHRLYTGSSTSQYISEATVFRDSLFTEMRNQPRSARGRVFDFQNMPRTEFNASVFKDLSKPEVWVKNLISRDSYYYQEPEVPLQWEFTQETKQIEQYTAIKATTSFAGRDYEAWFTLEVPIIDGPYVFSGLPGLILELYDTKKDYQFFLSSLTPLKEDYQINLEDANSKKLKKEEFIKFYKKNRENPTNSRARHISTSSHQFTDRSGRVITGTDIDRRMREEASKRNNQIEIW